MPGYGLLAAGFYCLLEVLEFEMRVEFGGVEVAMAEQLLHVPETGATTQQMRCARVPKGVHGGLHFGLQSVVADALGDHHVRKTTSGD
jgi:hypothetical protein